jgi:ABC-type nitrate/sulfonate/bicarbonate transport system ATPase subunit
VEQHHELITLEHIEKAYGDKNRIFVVVRDVNLKIWAGEFVCLLGPSGCGKSTWLRIIMGLNIASPGKVPYRRKPLAGINPHAIPARAILMVTHNIEEAVLLADRIIVMDKDPERVVTEMSVGLRPPRIRKDTAFQAFADKVYAADAICRAFRLRR